MSTAQTASLRPFLEVVDLHLTGLTDKQSAFVTEYVRSNNAYEAAIKAGYSENSAIASSQTILGSELVRSAVAIERSKMVPSGAHDLTDTALAQVLLDIALHGSPDSARVMAAKELRTLKGFGVANERAPRIGTINVVFQGNGGNLKDIRRALSAAELSTVETTAQTVESKPVKAKRRRKKRSG